MFPEPYSIGSSESKKLNSSILKEVFKISMDVVGVHGGVRLNLKNAVAKLAVTLVIMIFVIFAFFERYYFGFEKY